MSLADPAARGCVRAPAVRAYDIRGKAPSQVDPHDAHALGLAYAAQARQRGLSRIGVGRDGRITSPAFEAALVRGLAEGGMAVHRIGLGPIYDAVLDDRPGLAGAYCLLVGVTALGAVAVANRAQRPGPER